MVSHGHISVNGRKVTIPAYHVKPGEVIGLTARGNENPRIKENIEAGSRAVPSWLEWSPERKEARVLAMPGREEIDVPVQEQLIVEYYSR
jgi:small subunit ribosomal protein S4